MRGKHFSWSNWSDGPYFGTLEISSDRFPAVLPEGIWKGEGGKWSPGMWGGVWVRRGERQSWFVIGVAMLFPFDPVTKIKALARGMPARSIFRERKKIPKKKKNLKGLEINITVRLLPGSLCWVRTPCPKARYRAQVRDQPSTIP